MKLVLTYQVTDDCTYWDDVIVRFEYASVEAAKADLRRLSEEAYQSAKASHSRTASDFPFAGHIVDSSNLWKTVSHQRPKSKTPRYADVYNEPRIQILDEWFAAGLPVRHAPSVTIP